MTTSSRMPLRAWAGSALLLLSLGGGGAALAAWKRDSLLAAETAAASQPEHMETVTAALAAEREHRRTTTSIGTVVALRSITLHNELPGTVHAVMLEPGAIVDAGTVLVALDVSVEEAELRAQEAQVVYAASMLERMQKALEKSAASAADVDRARADHDIAVAQVARTKAIIARKTITAPFRARVGIADVHIGQYLQQGTRLTTLQGIDDAVHIEFMATQTVAAGLQPGDRVEVARAGAADGPGTGTVVAIDARVDPATRNAKVRLRLDGAGKLLAPGASVRVAVPVGEPRRVVTVPVSALRRGPAGDHVFVLNEVDGKTRAQMRPVRGGPSLGDDVVVLEGLAAGERVAAAGSFKLYESVLVAVAGDAGSGVGR